MFFSIQSILPNIADAGLMAGLSIAYGKLARLVPQRDARALAMGALFGAVAALSSAYHGASTPTLLTDNSAIFVGFAAAFLGGSGAFAALAVAVVGKLVFETPVFGDFVQLVTACLSGAAWTTLMRGWDRRRLTALIGLGLLLNVATMFSYLWPQFATPPSSPYAALSTIAFNIALSIMFGSFIERERGMLDAEIHLQHLANTDHLTGLHNRRTLMAAFENPAASRQGQALLLIDIDNFKSVNDAHGHQAGDHVLRHVAGYLQTSVRAGDILCRFGGEEFAVLLTATDAREAFAAAERLRGDIELNRVRIGQLALQVTISIGLKWWSGGMDFQRAFDAADTALYQAKNNGRNRVQLATEIERRTREPAQPDVA